MDPHPCCSDRDRPVCTERTQHFPNGVPRRSTYHSPTRSRPTTLRVPSVLLLITSPLIADHASPYC
eukprot:824802-Rhodomonas_salina.1